MHQAGCLPRLVDFYASLISVPFNLCDQTVMMEVGSS
jgi:hypothetical protein